MCFGGGASPAQPQTNPAPYSLDNSQVAVMSSVQQPSPGEGPKPPVAPNPEPLRNQRTGLTFGGE